MRVCLNLILLFVSACLFGACGAEGDTNFGLGDTNAVVSGTGDQLHPYLDGQTLVWFDLSLDPEGRCYGENLDGTWDNTCLGQVRSLELSTGLKHSWTEVMEGEVVPATSDGLVVWRCLESGERGLCIVAEGSSKTFRPGLGWSFNSWYVNGRPPAVDRGEVFWVGYDNEQGGYRIMGGDLRSGEVWPILEMDEYPYELVAFGGYLAWTVGRNENGLYRYHLEMMDRASGARTGVVDAEEQVFGLGGYGDRLGWKQGWVDYESEESTLHVYLRSEDGSVERVDSDESWVSAETPVAVGSDSLIWIDYRRGGYSVAAYRDGDDAETLLSSEQAMIGASTPPVVSGNRVVWSDRQLGDWDLVLHRL
ncbi:MAG: hypothetical protein JRF33_04855 [Deltaproteobacteria bacterium]|nr:hypothetical protein [Deltaproteobacteria bacterium]